MSPIARHTNAVPYISKDKPHFGYLCRGKSSAMASIYQTLIRERFGRKSPHADLRRSLSKYQKGRALEGTRGRKSWLFSRSTPMCVPSLRQDYVTTYAFRLVPARQRPLASAREDMPYVCVLRACMRAYKYNTRSTTKFTRTFAYTCVHIHCMSVRCLYNVNTWPPIQVSI